ncbi:hypothetical protein F503_07259 [Ophiostoma piceae UAMH 11346]|uniref:Uncharacterized protein n=1 Tax=Ophiostoma piceae (strain UAMH 11346) TaxID=1262450 RepID=S3CS69_OPHP1|nr:hypothetical protein F503_07259 [Ophiostoma piceae UAMH 11346]
MSLSANVEALLEVYSKCLGLLHVFGDSKKQNTGRSAVVSRPSAVPSHSPDTSKADWDRQSRLSRSLHSDRAKVMEVFSSRLSETGTRLAKGDPRSRSALRRIVNRLTNALSNIFSLRTREAYASQPDGQPLLNYDALRALSNSSRVGAIHTIDDLSVRLKQRAGSRTGSRSGQSVASVRSAKSIKSARLRKATPLSKRASSHTMSTAVPSRTSPTSAPSSSASQKPQHTKTKQEQSQQLPPALPGISNTTKKPSSSHDASKSKKSLRPSVASNRANSPTSVSPKSRKQDAAAKASKPKKKELSKTKHTDKDKKPSKEGSKTSRLSSAETHASGQVPPGYTQAATQTNSRGGSNSVASDGSYTSGSITSTAKAGPLHDGVRLDSRSKPKHSARPLSMLSSSSASTRLGEIPEHKLRRRDVVAEAQDGRVQDSLEYYNIAPAYPMRPLWMPDDGQAGLNGNKNGKEKEKKPDDKKWRFWGRGRA